MMRKVLDAFPWVADKFSFICEERNGAYVVCDCPIRCHKQARVRFTVGTDGVLLFKCMRECNKLEMLRAVGASWKDCYPQNTDWKAVKREITARYPYHAETGEVLYETVRLEPGRGGRDKDFFQRRPAGRGKWENALGDVRRVLYRLPELLSAKTGESVFVVSGEKDADTLRALGFVATTNVCGERSEWLDSYSETLAGRHVVVVRDADATGARHANEVCGSLMGYAASVRRVTLPMKDATAFVNALRVNGITTRAELRHVVWESIEEHHRWVVEGAA